MPPIHQVYVIYKSNNLIENYSTHVVSRDIHYAVECETRTGRPYVPLFLIIHSLLFINNNRPQNRKMVTLCYSRESIDTKFVL